MKHDIAHSRRSAGLKISAFAFAAVLASSGALSAQTAGGQSVFTMPDDICTWDWAGPATPQLMAQLKSQSLLAHVTMEMAKNCPEKLCEINWPGDAAASGSLPGEMLCELGHRQLFFEPLMETVAGICPDVAQLMTDRLPEVYGSCGTWPRAEPGGTGGGGLAPQPNGEDEQEPNEEEESGGEGDDLLPPEEGVQEIE